MGKRSLSSFIVLGFVPLLFCAGCGSGSSAPAAPKLPDADLTIHLFNSVGKPIHIDVENSQSQQQRDADGTSIHIAFDLKAGAHAKFRTQKSETIQFKVTGPPGMEKFNQSVDVPPANTQKGDVLLDFGARTTFYQYPMFYVPAKDAAKWKVPEATQRQYPIKKLPGPSARYDLDFKTIGINKGMKLFEQSAEPADKGSVYMSILTEDVLQRVNRGEDLNFIDRDEN